MRRRPPSLEPAWAKLAAVALDRAKGIVDASSARSGAPRLLKVEVRRGRGQLHLLWLMQPENRELVGRLGAVRHRLAAASVEACEVCGCHVPRRGPREEVFCEEHDVPF